MERLADDFWKESVLFLNLDGELQISFSPQLTIFPSDLSFKDEAQFASETLSSAADLANELLRIDLFSFFFNISEWYKRFEKRHIPELNTQHSTCGDLRKIPSAAKRRLHLDLEEHVHDLLLKYADGGCSPFCEKILYRACSAGLSIQLDNPTPDYIPHEDEPYRHLSGQALPFSTLYGIWAKKCAITTKLVYSSIAALKFPNIKKEVASSLLIDLNNGQKTQEADSAVGILDALSSPIAPGSVVAEIPITTQLSSNDTYRLGCAICLLIYQECLRLSKKSPSFSRNSLIKQYQPYAQSLFIGLGGHVSDTLALFIDLAIQVRKNLEATLVDPSKYSALDQLIEMAAYYSDNCLVPKEINGTGYVSERYIPAKYCLSDPTSLSRLLLHRAMIAKADGSIVSYATGSFPAFYQTIVGLLYTSGNNLKRCKKCGLPFFPSGNHSPYCDRLHLHPLALGAAGFGDDDIADRKLAHNAATSIKRKGSRQKNAALKKSYEHLGSFVDKVAGPYYQKEPSISNETYEEWRSLNVRIGSEELTSESFPIYVIWDNRVIDGQTPVDVSGIAEDHPDFQTHLNDLKDSVKIHDQGIEEGSCALPAYRLMEEVVRFNKKLKKESKGKTSMPRLPFPGISPSEMGNYYRLANALTPTIAKNEDGQSGEQQSDIQAQNNLSFSDRDYKTNVRYRKAPIHLTDVDMANAVCLKRNMSRSKKILSDLKEGKLLLSSLFNEHRPLDVALGQNYLESLLTNDPHLDTNSGRKYLKSIGINTMVQLKRLPASQLCAFFSWVNLTEGKNFYKKPE